MHFLSGLVVICAVSASARVIGNPPILKYAKEGAAQIHYTPDTPLAKDLKRTLGQSLPSTFPALVSAPALLVKNPERSIDKQNAAASLDESSKYIPSIPRDAPILPQAPKGLPVLPRAASLPPHLPKGIVVQARRAPHNSVSKKAPRSPIRARSIVSEVGSVIEQLITSDLSPTSATIQLRGLLGSAVDSLDEALGTSLASKLLSLQIDGASTSVIELIGEGVARLISGLGIDEVNDILMRATDGTVTSLSDALGVADIEKALNLTQ